MELTNIAQKNINLTQLRMWYLLKSKLYYGGYFVLFFCKTLKFVFWMKLLMLKHESN